MEEKKTNRNETGIEWKKTREVEERQIDKTKEIESAKMETKQTTQKETPVIAS